MSRLGINMKWISVKDQLPPACKDVLLWNIKGFHILGYLNDHNEFVEHQKVDDIVYAVKDITHWMKLPLGPDEEEINELG